MSTRTHQVLVIGAGSIGERHIRCFQATGRARVSVCEPSEARRAEICDRYGIDASYSDFQSALTSDFDAAVIATPANYHLSQATELVRRGAHVLIEKPLSVTREGLSELRSAVRDHPVTCAVAYPYRAHPALSAMWEGVNSGRFGRPLQLTVVAGQNFPTYRPAYAGTYYNSRATGGGAIQDALTHIVNAAEWLIGPMTRVVSDADHKRLVGVDVEDTVHVLARHGDVLASYALNQHQPANEMTIEVICEAGQARFEYHKAAWRALTEVDGVWEDHSFIGLERDELFTRQATSFLDAVERRRQPACTLEEGVQTLAAVLAILESLDAQQWIPVQRGAP